ncbi:MAG: hypothetical protein AABY22_03395 [Nanoarchaeota archaeon]
MKKQVVFSLSDGWYKNTEHFLSLCPCRIQSIIKCQPKEIKIVVSDRKLKDYHKIRFLSEEHCACYSYYAVINDEMNVFIEEVTTEYFCGKNPFGKIFYFKIEKI